MEYIKQNISFRKAIYQYKVRRMDERVDRVAAQAERVMNIAEELYTNPGKGSKIYSNAKIRYRNWLIGMIVSFIPVLALPLSRIYMGEPVGIALFDSFCSSEIIFIGISLAIASLNDFLAREADENKQGWTWINIILIILGAMVYGVTVITEELSAGRVGEKAFNYDLAFGFNVFFLLIIFLLGSARYIKEMWGK